MSEKKVQNNHTIYVKTFGSYSVSYNGAEIAIGSRDESQIGLLMLLMFHFGKDGASRSLIKSTLFEDRDIEDVSHAIRNILYNMRKNLKAHGLPNAAFVKQKKGVYYWTDEVPIVEDAREFEALLNEAAEIEATDQRMVKLADACYSYAGRFFAGRDNSDKAVDMDDARLIYERISGDDTIFGIPVRRGGLLASKVFVSNAQNRTLSLSFFNVNDPSQLLFSPLFQNELAGYLSVTYIDEATRETSFGRINSWFVLTWMAFALAAVSVLLYLSNLGLSVTGNDTKKAPVSMWVFGVIGGTSIALAIGIIASSFVDALHAAMPFILVLLPLIFMTALFIINFTWITTKDGKFVPHRNGLIPAVFLAVVIGLFIMLILALTTDLKVYRIADPGLASGVLAFILVLDTTVASGLIYASRKSSTAGEGAKNCFGNLKIFLLMLIPAAASLLFGIMPWHREILYCGLGGLAATGIPFLAVLPLVRHTDRSLIPLLAQRSR